MKNSVEYLLLLSVLFACAKTEEEPQPGPDPEPEPVAVESVQIDPQTAEIVEGDSLTLRITVLPENATDKSYTLTSSKEAVATIDSTGKVLGLSVGTTVITATAGGKTANSMVKVLKDPTVFIRALKITDQAFVLKVGESVAVTYTKYPAGATEKITWSSGDDSVACVNELGEVTALARGRTVIVASTRDCRAELPVEVTGSDYYIARVDALTRVVNNQRAIDDTEPVRVARGETAAIQICLTPYFDVSSIDARVSLPDPGLEPRLYWEREITCSRHWDYWAGGAAPDEVYTNSDKYFDPLMPMDVWNPAPVSADGNIVLWCEFDVPRGFAPGTYEASVTFDVNSGQSEISRTFEFQVYSATLPEDQGLTVINWECGNFKAMNGGQNMEYHTTWEPLMTVLVEFMNDYGQNAWRTIYATQANMEDRCKADYTTTPYSVKYNFDSLWGREFELYVNKCHNLHQVHGQQIASSNEGKTDLQIRAYVLDYDDPDDLGRPSLKLKDCYATQDDENAREVKAGLAEYFRQLAEYLRSHAVGDGRTWLDLYVQTIVDEPNGNVADAYNAVARVIKTGCPEMKITDAIETDKIDPELLDYPCPTLKYIEECRAAGNQTQWMYTCVNPQGNYANRFIRIPTIKTRIVHWCNYYYNAPAYLHWGLKYWQGAKDGDPYGDAYGQFIGGDNFIIYPDYHKVYPSIRLCAMRDGIRDYDLLKAIEVRSGAKAKEFLGRVVKGAADYDTDVADFRQTRREMLEFLSE